MSDRKKYSVGDMVFVVPQRGRRKEQPSGEMLPIAKVGRKWCYVKRYGDSVPFDPKTGESVHKEWNTRANGYGFDVHESEAAYRKAERERQDNARLAERLRRISSAACVNLPPDVVAQILAILDKHEQEVMT